MGGTGVFVGAGVLVGCGVFVDSGVLVGCGVYVGSGVLTRCDVFVGFGVAVASFPAQPTTRRETTKTVKILPSFFMIAVYPFLFSVILVRI
jgi:tetrahydrodipicolinate N-succinyltransferase